MLRKFFRESRSDGTMVDVDFSPRLSNAKRAAPHRINSGAGPMARFGITETRLGSARAWPPGYPRGQLPDWLPDSPLARPRGSPPGWRAA